MPSEHEQINEMARAIFVQAIAIRIASGQETAEVAAHIAKAAYDMARAFVGEANKQSGNPDFSTIVA